MYNDHKVKPLHIMLPKTNAYFLIEDDGLLEKYNTNWDKVSANIKKNLIASLSTIKNF